MAVGEWDQRLLCPDGGCVGVIGPEGTCKVCGRAAQNWGDERKRGLLDPPNEGEGEDDVLAADANDTDDDEDADDDDEDTDDDDDADDDDGADDGDAATPVHAAAASLSAGEWGSRQLCPEGGCIGVIGVDGTCKVCGRAAPGSPRAAASGPAAADKPGDPGGAVPPGDTPPPGDPDSRQRARCSDPVCSGMIGLDGHCEVCGKVGA
jgi:hypothetical protein